MKPTQPLRPVLQLALLAFLTTTTACAWVDLTEGGENVRVLNAAGAANCERLGTTTSNVPDRVGFIDRSDEKQAEELERLARNEAAVMDGNAVVPDSEVEEGRQRFIVYYCESLASS